MTVMLAIFLGLSAVPPELGPAWAEFRRAPAARLVRTKVEIGTLGYDRKRGQLEFWLRRSVVSGSNEKENVSWTDTRTCVAARPLIASMRDIPVPKFAPIGSSDGPPIVLDGVGYSLKTYSDQGMLTAETNVGTPVASWIEGALKALDSCWGTSTPKRTD